MKIDVKVKEIHPDIKVHNKPLDSMTAQEMQVILDTLGWGVKEVQNDYNYRPYYTVMQRVPNTDVWNLAPPFMLVGSAASRFPTPVLAMRAALRIHFKMLRKNKDEVQE